MLQKSFRVQGLTVVMSAAALALVAAGATTLEEANRVTATEE